MYTRSPEIFFKYICKSKNSLYICAQILRITPYHCKLKKRIIKCPDKKEHTSPQSAREETSMVLGSAWLP